MHLAVGILRVQEGLDYSNLIEDEDQVNPQQLLEVRSNNIIPRNQSESQLSQGIYLNFIFSGAPPSFATSFREGKKLCAGIYSNVVFW